MKYCHLVLLVLLSAACKSVCKQELQNISDFIGRVANAVGNVQVESVLNQLYGVFCLDVTKKV